MSIKCAICMDDVPQADKFITPCNHEFCIGCIFSYIHHEQFNRARKIPCPLCRTDIKILREYGSGERPNLIYVIMCCLCRTG